jgi:hypothetical protein
MKQLKMALVFLALAATFCVGAWSQDETLMDVQARLESEAVDACRQVANAADTIYLLAQLGYSAPDETTSRTHLEAIVFVVEGAYGADVRLSDFSDIIPAARGLLPTERVDPYPYIRVRSDGLLGALAYAAEQLAHYREFALAHVGDVASYYNERHVYWDGARILTTHLDRLDSCWQQVDALCRFALEVAVVGQEATDRAAVGSALLEISAYATAVVGYPDRFSDDERPRRWNEIGSGEFDVPCVFYCFNKEIYELEQLLFETMWWMDEKQNG